MVDHLSSRAENQSPENQINSTAVLAPMKYRAILQESGANPYYPYSSAAQNSQTLRPYSRSHFDVESSRQVTQERENTVSSHLQN